MEALAQPPRRSNARLVLMAAVVNGVSAVVGAGLLVWLVTIMPAPDMLAPDGLAQAAEPSATDRLAYAGSLLIWPAALLLAMVVAVSASRAVTGAFNPLRDEELWLYRVHQRILANSVEQSAVLLPALVAVALTVPGPWLVLLPAAVTVFIIGRVLFWVGFVIHGYARAPGMTITLVAVVALVGAGLLAALGLV